MEHFSISFLISNDLGYGKERMGDRIAGNQNSGIWSLGPSFQALREVNLGVMSLSTRDAASRPASGERNGCTYRISFLKNRSLIFDHEFHQLPIEAMRRESSPYLGGSAVGKTIEKLCMKVTVPWKTRVPTLSCHFANAPPRC